MSGLSPQGPMNQLLNAAAGLVVVALMLYAAVWIIQQIWLWLLGIAVAAMLIWLLVTIVRRRRSRF